MTFTFLLDLSNPIIRTMYKESLNSPIKPSKYQIDMKQFEINDGSVNFIGNFDTLGGIAFATVEGDLVNISNTLYEKVNGEFIISPTYSKVKDNGDVLYSKDLSFNKKVIYGEVQPADIVRGEPIIFSIGFVLSAS